MGVETYNRTLADKLPEKVSKIIARYSMLPAASRVGVAVSGGADSIVLLEILKRFPVKLTVLHVNHGLRGAESDGDERFVNGLAAAAGLPFVSARLEPGQGNLEQEARRLRREFFLSLALDRIALGHTRSDQAETVLHRFLRGTGPTGMAAMRHLTPDGFIRPLLDCSRSEVREWARERGLAWREDSSNADPQFTRNRLRNELLPALARDFNANLETVLAATAQLAQAEEDFWNEEIEKLYGIFAKRTRLGSFLQIGDLAGLHLALRRRLIRRALAEVRSAKMRGLDFEHIEAVLALCDSTEGHDRVLIPGADALRSFDTLLLMPPGKLAEDERGYRRELSWGSPCRLPAGAGEICIERIGPETPVYDTFKKDWESGVEHVCLGGEALSKGPLLVRNWEPGDELLRAGHRTAEKIKKLFQEHHIKLWERRHWPVLLCNGEIGWVRQFGVAARFVAKAGEQALRLTYRPEQVDESKATQLTS